MEASRYWVAKMRAFSLPPFFFNAKDLFLAPRNLVENSTFHAVTSPEPLVQGVMLALPDLADRSY